MWKITFAKKFKRDRHIRQFHASPLREKCLVCIFPHLDQKTSEYGNFSRSAQLSNESFEIVLLERHLFNLALNLCSRGKLALRCELKLSHATHSVKTARGFKNDLHLYPTECIISFPVISQICSPTAILLDLLYIYYCKCKKRTKINYWDLISLLINLIFFRIEKKRLLPDLLRKCS